VPGLPGLHVFPDFLSEAEERELVRCLDDPALNPGAPWKPSTFNGAHIGRGWGVARRGTPPGPAIPSYLDFVLARMRGGDYLPTATFVPNGGNAIDYRKCVDTGRAGLDAPGVELCRAVE
jgi:hypothetical protein